MKIVLFGIGTLADLALHYFTSDSQYDVAAFTVDKKYVQAATHRGKPLVPFEEVAERFPPSDHCMFVAVGYVDCNQVRASKCRQARELGYELATYVSSDSINRSKKMGENCFIFEGAILQPFTELGDGVIVWPGTILSHHSIVGECCYLSPNVTICGNVKLGNNIFVGAGAVIKDAIAIQNDIVIGMGSVVTTDLHRSGVYVGSPAKLKQSANLKTII